MPVSPIFRMIREESYDELIQYVEDYPSVAASLNTAKATPISVLVKSTTRGNVFNALCWGDAYYIDGVQDAFDALVNAYPAGVGIKDKRGDTVLTIACRDGDGLRTYPENNGYRAQILIWMVERMIAAAAVPDAHEKLPIQHLCQYHRGGYGPIDLVVKLARAYPASIQKGGILEDMIRDK